VLSAFVWALKKLEHTRVRYAAVWMWTYGHHDAAGGRAIGMPFPVPLTRIQIYITILQPTRLLTCTICHVI
jgi:hypothetical protein